MATDDLDTLIRAIEHGDRLPRSESHRQLAVRCALANLRLTDAEIAEVAHKLADEVSNATD